MLLADIFPAGWRDVKFSSFKPGEFIAVSGVGPISLMATYSVVLRGASEVIYVVDCVPECLTMAKEIGCIPIDFSKGTATLLSRSRSTVAGMSPGSSRCSLSGADICPTAKKSTAASALSATRLSPPTAVLKAQHHPRGPHRCRLSHWRPASPVCTSPRTLVRLTPTLPWSTSPSPSASSLRRA